MNYLSNQFFSSPIRRNRGAYVITLALAYTLPAWSNLCVQGLFSDTVYTVALKLHTLTLEWIFTELCPFLDLEFWSNLCVQGLFSDNVYAVALKLHTLIQGHYVLGIINRRQQHLYFSQVQILTCNSTA